MFRFDHQLRQPITPLPCIKTNLVASLTREKCLYKAWPGTGFRPTGPIEGPGGEPA